MIIAWPSWVMWLFVVWMVVNIFWIGYKFIKRRPIARELLLEKMHAATLVAHLHGQIAALQARLMENVIEKSGVKAKVVGTTGINKNPLSPEDEARIKDLGGAII